MSRISSRIAFVIGGRPGFLFRFDEAVQYRATTCFHSPRIVPGNTDGNNGSLARALRDGPYP